MGTLRQKVPVPLETTGEKNTKKTGKTSGLPESFRILTLFDKKFQSLWKPQVKKIQKRQEKRQKDKKDERAARVFSDSHTLRQKVPVPLETTGEKNTKKTGKKTKRQKRRAGCPSLFGFSHSSTKSSSPSG